MVTPTGQRVIILHARYESTSSRHSPHSAAEQGLANYSLQANSNLLPVSVNKVLLEHSHVSGCFSATRAKSRRNCMQSQKSLLLGFL